MNGSAMRDTRQGYFEQLLVRALVAVAMYTVVPIVQAMEYMGRRKR